MEREIEAGPASISTHLREARVGLLIPTHALPALSYHIPDHLEERVRPGTAVVAPLSGYSRLGIVLDVEDSSGDSREYITDAIEDFSIPPALSGVCRNLSELFAVPLPSVLRMALPSGLNIGRYEIVDPAPDWTWNAGSTVSRAKLRRVLGGENLKKAEAEGRLRFTVSTPKPEYVEWVEVRAGAEPDLGRAPKQREIYEALLAREGGCPSSDLLSASGASRGTLRELVRRGAIRLQKQPETPPILSARGSQSQSSFARDAGRVADRGNAWFWRTPSREQPEAVAAVAQATIEGGEQALVLVPEVEYVERLVEYLVAELPAGCTVAPYHSGLGKKRGGVYDGVRRGRIDVLVGTRTAALLPMKRLGAVCVVDEPNRAHRAEPGYEGLPIHVREIALERSKAEDCGVLFLSPFPTFRVSAPVSNLNELPARPDRHWPAARIVDMRGSGANLSPDLLDLCRQGLEDKKRIAVIANRLGYATSVSCNNCGAVRACPDCDLPLTLREPPGTLACSNCGYQEEYSGRCEVCGSDRVRPTGFAIDRMREDLSRKLDAPLGKLTADVRETENAHITVATARFVVNGDWDVVVVPDIDTLLLGSYTGANEQAFRLLYGAAEAAGEKILVQTRQPGHPVLRAALQGDYPGFSNAEIPKLRALEYPPYGHLADVVLEGREESVRRAVELRLRPALEPGVSMSNPIPLVRPGEAAAWRVLLRSTDQRAVARCGVLASRLATKARGPNELKTRVEVDPEEV